MNAWHQQNILDNDFPFKLFFTEQIQFPPHWHEAIEIVYVMDGKLKVGINNNVYYLEKRDILIIGTCDVHYYMPQKYYSKAVIIQFEQNVYSSISGNINDIITTQKLFNSTKHIKSIDDTEIHAQMELQITKLIEEYNQKLDGYKLALKARLYDLFTILLRKLPIEDCVQNDKEKQISKLKRLEKIYQYVEKNYGNDISLKEAANNVNLSEFHFSHFFKKTTGMSFKQFLSSFRIKKAEWLLINSNDSITEIAFKSGFNSVKTFNRVFKKFKGCSPTDYKKAISEK